ncbi:S8 family serine peptidase [Ornithinimicrobium cryptoxanthini]|uniref:S8 family serine peptidase n=1 Tax=Ornithinimicrobium cryptoxanthini TaxID=2934161 RepID=UPI002118C029|nr:S8 family serine peptidase [Ornithinimicrobium cryptoxanthini]
MSERYVITARDPGARAEAELPDDVRVVAALDRGQLVDAEPQSVQELEARGFRVKQLHDPHLIRFFSYEIDTERGTTPQTPPEFRDQTESEGVNHLVLLAGPAQESWLATLAERGVRLVEPVSPFAYFVRAEAGTVAGLSALPFVEWTGPLEPAYKVNPLLLGLQDEAPGVGPIEALDVGVLADGDIAAVTALIETEGGTVELVGPETSDAYVSIRAQLPREALAAVAAHPDVRWVDAIHTPQLEDERGAQIVFEDLDGAAAPNTAPNVGYAANLTALGADGAGVTIAICDTGVSTNDPATVHDDLAGRMAFAVTGNGGTPSGGDTNGHGTHVAGIAAGDGGSGDTDPQGFLLGMGVATGAMVGSVVANSGWQQLVATSAQQGAQVMNNSLSMNGPTYTADDRRIDLGVRDADPAAAGITPLVIVFSAGNSGPGATTVTKSTKNAMLVGNALNARPGEGDPADDIRGLRTSSSRGAAADGRTLPHVTAPGTDIISARSAASARVAYEDTAGTTHADHTSMTGTSMAAPHVAGASAVLIDWWRQSRGGATPSPALLKALLVASTEPVAGGTDGNGGTIAAGPTNNAGWGRISLENALLQGPASDRGPKIFVDQRQAFTATGQEYRIRVAAADPARPLRVTLTWTDAAGAVGANPALVNDLDLEVQQVGGSLFRGNVFTGAWSSTGGTADSLNNTEGVAIQSPTGVYEISVVAANVSASARTDIATPWQDFALVIDNAEVPAADPVSVVTVLDRSGSMQTLGYVDVTRQTSRQFIDLLSVDDSVGVVSFGDTGREEFPGTGTPQAITGQPTRDDAIASVDAIGFGGCTFMGAGIERGGAMLGAAGSRRALVLLSDGYDNKGCDPGNAAKPSALDAAAALPASLPIYSCAMGPASDQVLLAQLAENTDGRYYFMPTIDDLFEIYNYIRGQVTGDGIIVNESSVASRSEVSGWVDGCAASVLFTVAWHDQGLHYVSREARKNNEVSVRLRTPGGRWLSFSSAEFARTVGAGYVSFALQEPEAGQWTVEVSTRRRQHTAYTVGGFVRSPLRLEVDAPHFVGVGQPIGVLAVVRDGKEPLSGVKVRTTVTPPPPYKVLLDKFARQLRAVRLPDVVDGRPHRLRDDLTRLSLLRDELLAKKGEDILASSQVSVPMDASGRLGARELVGPLDPRARITFPGDDLRAFNRNVHHVVAAPGLSTGPLVVTPAVSPRLRDLGWLLDPRVVARPRLDGGSTGRFGDTKQSGSYTVQVTAAGFSPACGTRFVRKDLVSVVVGKRG